MFHRLELKNCFTHQDAVFELKKGLTAISGLNGKGKTLIPEMLSFCLWGAKALRGEVTTYKGVWAAAEFDLRGKTYRVERTTSMATLFESGVKIVTGTTPVNSHIEGLFGYSFEVFKVTNIARQGEIEAMGNMKPTARKALIDETIGLSKIEGLQEWAKVEKANAKTQYQAVASMMGTRPADLPEPPPEVTPQQVMVFQKQYGTFCAHAPYSARPEEVKQHERYDELESLRAQKLARMEAQARIRGIDAALKTMPEFVGVAPKLSIFDTKLEEMVRQTNRYDEINQAIKSTNSKLKLFPDESQFTNEFLDECEAIIEMRKRWKRRNELQKELAEYVCPACDHHWHDEDPRLKDYADVPIEQPVLRLTSAEIAIHRAVNAYQDKRKELLEMLATLTEGLTEVQSHAAAIQEVHEARQKVRIHEETLKMQQARNELLETKAGIEIPEDVSELLQEVEAQAMRVAEYERALGRHLEALVNLQGIPGDIEQKFIDAREGQEKWNAYVAQRQAYHVAMDKWTENEKRLVELEKTMEDWNQVGMAIIALRVKIKGYLLPNLNMVASKLLALMSNSWLSRAEIDENFEMRADGKLVHLLSGAGKALTNLALRIGLGQVLTNSVFPVLMLDEADHGVDQEKAPMIMEALKALTGTIVQVIVISHKAGLAADQRIEL